MITVVSVPFEDERAHALWDAQQDELSGIYGERPDRAAPPSDGVFASLLALDADGEPVGAVLARWSHYHHDRPGTAEIKRLYVAPEHRGHRHARVLMGALERAAWRAGATELVLETGRRQPVAIAVYRGIGYTETGRFGAYAAESDAVCLAKHLPTRVLVINGTIGAGKTTTAAAVHDLLTEEGARSAFNLTALAPVYRARGYGCIVLARVVEDVRDRDTYAEAFAGPGGRAHVSIVRVTALLDTRVSRITHRESDGYWRDFGLARTVELDDVLEDLDLDDGVVSSEGASRLEVATAALDAAGW